MHTYSVAWRRRQETRPNDYSNMGIAVEKLSLNNFFQIKVVPHLLVGTIPGPQSIHQE